MNEWKELRLWARDETKGRAIVDRVGATFYNDAETAVRGANVVASTTAFMQPILRGTWLKLGAFVTSVGWNTSEGRELDDAAMAHTVIVESSEAAKDQAGNIRGSNCAIFSEASEIYAGLKSVTEASTIVYDSVGIAIMDVTAAELAYDLWLAAQ